jgi:hypothetical protein
MASPSHKRPRLDDQAPDSNAAGASLPPSPAPTPGAAEERRLFRLWIEASRLAAASAVQRAEHPDGKEPETDRKARRAAHDAYQDALAALGLDGRGSLAYDPVSRRFVDHRPAVDARPSSRLHFQYYPVAQHHPARQPPPPPPPQQQQQHQQQHQQQPLQRRFELRVVNPDTKRRAPPCTIATLERHLPRRYRGASPRRVGVLRLLSEQAVACCEVAGVEVREYDLTAAPFAAAAEGAAADGGAFNRAFLQAVEGDGCDVILVWRGGGRGERPASQQQQQQQQQQSEQQQRQRQRDVLRIDHDLLFHPAYPVWLEGGAGLLLSPLHVYQVDGCETRARDVIQSLLDRASGVLGALVVERGGGGGPNNNNNNRLPYMRYDRQRHQREPGLAHTRTLVAAAASASSSSSSSSAAAAASIEADGRALLVTGRLGVGRYVPTFPHGWLSDDTAILLATALRVFRPQRVLELGAWLGLSSRFILREGKGSLRRFVSVDHFKVWVGG